VQRRFPLDDSRSAIDPAPVGRCRRVRRPTSTALFRCRCAGAAFLATDQLGRRPALREVRADSVDKWLHLIERGHGIDTCPAYVARYYSWPTISYVPLVAAPPTTLAILRRAGDRSPLAAALLEAVREIAVSDRARAGPPTDR
jgi:LysR substrate binding domain